MPLWLTRLIISALIVLFLIGIYYLLKFRSLSTGAKKGRDSLPLTEGVSTLLYFSTPDCTLCHNAQKPVIEQIKVNMGENLKVVEINAYEQPRLAQDWGILSVPATVVLGKDGNPRSINYGFTPYNNLIQQIES
jgi:hypothetical protein